MFGCEVPARYQSGTMRLSENGRKRRYVPKKDTGSKYGQRYENTAYLQRFSFELLVYSKSYA